MHIFNVPHRYASPCNLSGLVKINSLLAMCIFVVYETCRSDKSIVLTGYPLMVILTSTFLITNLLFLYKTGSRIKKHLLNTGRKALQARLNPHFIFNSLNSISDFIAKNNKQAADDYILKFAKLMRRVLEHSEQEEIPLSEDLKTLSLYLELECLRLNNKFSFGIKVEDGIDIENTLVQPHLIQPFVENSIWHGIARKEGRGKITVQVKREFNMLKCIIEDDGVGRMEAMRLSASGMKETRKSFGIKLTHQRIDLLSNGKIKSPSLRFIDLPAGTRAEINLPVNIII